MSDVNRGLFGDDGGRRPATDDKYLLKRIFRECEERSKLTNTIPWAPHFACLEMPRICSSLPSPSTPHLTKWDPCYDILAKFSRLKC